MLNPFLQQTKKTEQEPTPIPPAPQPPITETPLPPPEKKPRAMSAKEIYERLNKLNLDFRIV